MPCGLTWVGWPGLSLCNSDLRQFGGESTKRQQKETRKLKCAFWSSLLVFLPLGHGCKKAGSWVGCLRRAMSLRVCYS